MGFAIQDVYLCRVVLDGQQKGYTLEVQYGPRKLMGGRLLSFWDGKHFSGFAKLRFEVQNVN